MHWGFGFQPKPPVASSLQNVIHFFTQKSINVSLSVKQLSQIHAHFHVSGLQGDTFLLNQLLRFCALSELNYARNLLLRSHHSSCFSWNILIRGFSSRDSPSEAIWVFREMRRRGTTPDNFTFPFVFKACATITALKVGRQVHADVLKCGLDDDVYVQNNLVHFYGSCKKISYALRVFEAMSERTVVSWNTVITACVENSWFNNGVGYFLRMINCGFEPNETTMVVILSACAELGNLSLGRWVHSQAIQKELVLNCHLGTALVDMYAKSGALVYARLVFDRLKERNVLTWNAMILGLAQHGFAEEALDLFRKMKNSSIRPSHVTFLGVLCACSHAGLVQNGYRYFHDMEHVHGIKPMVTHYGAMVDILARAGRLSEAYTFISNMPIEPVPIVWRTLLSACRTHDVNDHEGVADKVRERLLELEPSKGCNLVMVAKMYAEVGMWEKAAEVRKVMKDGRMKKSSGESCIEVGGSIRRFLSGYDSQADDEGVYQLLDGMNLQMKMVYI